MEQETKIKCSHCGKACDESKCVKEDDKHYCCKDCCKQSKEKGEIKESPNVCKFC